MASAAAVFQSGANTPTKPSITNCSDYPLILLESANIHSSNAHPNHIDINIIFNNHYGIIENGTIEYTAKLNSIPYYYTDNICSNNLQCPITLGRHQFSSFPVNVGNIRGHLQIMAQFKNENGKELLCVFADMMVSDGKIIGLEPGLGPLATTPSNADTRFNDDYGKMYQTDS